MEIIVADANVFVYFFRCRLLEVFLLCSEYDVKITAAVEQEITDRQKRISREHPELRHIVSDAIHNQSGEKKIEVVDVQTRLDDIDVMEIYYQLEESGELDIGEIESIPLACYLNASFISNDEDALRVANEFREGVGVSFMVFCDRMLSEGVIESKDHQAIVEFMKNY